eukprot:TRINITY_DN94863_c0_g1_i1.p1 TRINITY_DN94863_c0_g1~~TRINITY_DN94863_c0_g1_i1.p1  ORF type:complete len:432 (+),score=26.33 TRINITY_DN94863_c0_g1_i1:23-1318(+)
MLHRKAPRVLQAWAGTGWNPGFYATGPKYDKRNAKGYETVRTHLPARVTWAARWDWYDHLWRPSHFKGAYDCTQSARPRANVVFAWVASPLHQYFTGPLFNRVGRALENFGKSFWAYQDAMPLTTSPRRCIKFGSNTPFIDKSYGFVAPSASLIGDVRVGPGVSIWYSALLKGDSSSVTLDTGACVMDRAIINTKSTKSSVRPPVRPSIRTEHDGQGTCDKYLTDKSKAWIQGNSPVTESYIGVEAMVDTLAVVNGPCVVEERATIGSRAVIGEGCVIGKGAVVASGAFVPPGTVVPPYTHYVGCLYDIVGRPGTELDERDLMVMEELFDTEEDVAAVDAYEKDLMDSETVAPYRSHMKWQITHIKEHNRNEGMTVDRMIDELATLAFAASNLRTEMAPPQDVIREPTSVYNQWQWGLYGHDMMHRDQERL